MTNKIMRLASKLTTAAMVVSMVATAMPAAAEGATSVSDTLSRLAVSETLVDHTLSFTLGSAIATAATLTFDYSGAGFTSLASPVCDGATTEAIVVDDLVITASAALSGAVECTFTATNPSGVGSKKVSYVSSEATPVYEGALAIAIVDSDQVTISAVVDPTLTFDLDTAETNTESAAPYTVALGTLPLSGVNASGDAGINYIWFDLATNATGGAIVTVSSLNAALQSASVITDEIVSRDMTLGNTTATLGYGMCANTFATGESEAGDVLTVAAFATCASTTVDGLTTGLQNVATADGPLSAGRGQLSIKAAINALTPAHNDYSDVLTFVATATF